MGKYTAFLDRLPKIQRVRGEDGSLTDYSETPDYKAKVDAEKDRVEDKTPAGLAAQYGEARAAVDAHKEIGKPLNLRVAALEQLIVDAYEESDVSSLKLADGSAVRTQPEVTVSFDKEVLDAREVFRQWALASGYERSMSLPTQTRDAIVKEMLVAGKEQPPGITISVYTKVVLTKGKL